MRTFILSLSLAAVAAPAFAQNTLVDLDNLRAQQQDAARRAVAQDNELSALQSRLQTEQAVTQLQTQRLLPPRAPELRYTAADAAGASAAVSKYPAIPDAALADSNRRVRAASQRPR